MPGRRSFALLCAATFGHFLAMGIFLSGLPLFVDQVLEASKAAVGLAVGAFSITAVATRPFVGRLVDRRGRRPFLIGAPVLVAASAAGLMLNGGYLAVFALRLVQGAAGAAFYTSAATVATDLAPEEQRASIISRFSLFLYAGFSIGPWLGEWLVIHSGYRAAWTAALLSSLAASVLATRVIETKPAAEEHETPLPRRLIHPAAVGPGLVLMTVAVGYTAIGSFAPLYARSIGMSSSGTLYAAFAVTIFAVRLLSGRLADRFGRAEVALPGLVAGGVGMLLLATVASPAAAFVGVSLFGACHALAFPALMALTIDRVTKRERGEALGSFTACFDVGAAGGGYVVGAIADRAGFDTAWLAPALLCVIGALALVRMIARDPARDDDAALAAPAGTSPATPG